MNASISAENARRANADTIDRKLREDRINHSDLKLLKLSYKVKDNIRRIESDVPEVDLTQISA